MNTEIFIENRRLDITADISTLLNFAIDDIKDFAARSTTWSKTIILPGTANNNKLFGHIFQIGQSNAYTEILDNVNYNFNAAKSADCIIFQDQMQTFKGVLRLMQINITKGQIEYEVAVFGEIFGLNVSLSGGLIEDLDFSEYDHPYNASGVTSRWANTSGVDVYYPLIDYGTYSTTKDDWDIRTFRPALHVREYIDKMMTAANFRWESDLFDTARFKSLIIPHNQKELRYNSSDIAEGILTTPYLVLQTLQTQKNIKVDTFTSSAFSANVEKTVFTYDDTPNVTLTLTWTITGDYFADIADIEVFFVFNGVRQPSFDLILPANGTNPQSFTWSHTTILSFSTTDFIEFKVLNTDHLNNTCEVNINSVNFTLKSSVPIPVPVLIGDTVIMNDIIPQNIKQIDFLSGIIKLFNLYAYESLTDSRLIRFTPYIDFYSDKVYPSPISIGTTNVITVSSGSASTQIRPSTNFTSGKLYLLFVSNAKATTPEEATVTGTSQTWTKVEGLTFNTIGSPTQRITVYRFLAASTFSATTTISFGVTQLSISSHLYQIAGIDTSGTNGSGAIVQAITNSADATANPTVTMDVISNANNAVILYAANNQNPFGGTAESGWTEQFDNGYASPDRGDYSMHRLTTTDNTPTVTAASSNWAAIGIELKSAEAETIDWTYKLNRDKTIKIRPMSELTAKKYEFKFKPDSDFYNEAYRKRYSQGYGDHVFDSEFEFAEANKSFEIVFSATPLVGYTGEDKVFPTIFKSSNDVEERIDSNIRIMQSKKITGVTSWDIKDGVTVLASTTDYGYAGHFDDPDAPANDLNFGALRELFFTLASGDLTATQFNVYWSAYMAEITDKDSKLLSAWFYLTAKDIFNLDFSKKIWIDGVLFRLNSIKDYNVSNISDCEIELLKINFLIY